MIRSALGQALPSHPEPLVGANTMREGNFASTAIFDPQPFPDGGGGAAI
jgi:hypothetical protein